MFPGSPAPSQLSDPAANDLTAALADILPANALGEGLPVAGWPVPTIGIDVTRLGPPPY
jgi:hypothetical protein